jgi:cellulose synthase/poly-beta-1,6-N-acetylglucosamine synthase-like glycosyltransferase
VIIPTRPGQETIPALTAARQLRHPQERIEFCIARGRQPAVQRNEAIKSAKGDLIYFLDDDAQPRSENLERALAHFRDPKVKMLGGPNICPQDAPLIEQAFAVTLSSWLAFGPSRARYQAIGKARRSSEKELILCNLMARRDALLELGGFDASLYPNEENALMDKLQQRGGILIYDPEIVAHRRPRPTLRAFIKMLLTYGRGRAEQFRVHPTPGSAMNFVPPLFCLYLLLFVVPALAGLLSPSLRLIGLVTLALYVSAVVAQTVYSAATKNPLHAFLAMPLISLTHIFYGLGFWRGLFTRLRARTPVDSEVSLERA